MAIPTNQPMSSDIIDRRNGQTPTLAEKVRDLMVKVQKDYQDSQNHGQGMTPSQYGPTSDPNAPLHPNDAAGIKAKVHQILGSPDDDALSADAAARIRSKVNSGQ